MAEVESVVKVDSSRLISRAAALGAHLAANPSLYSEAKAIQLVHGKRKEGTGEDLFVVSAQVSRHILYIFIFKVALKVKEAYIFKHLPNFLNTHPFLSLPTAVPPRL